MSPDIKPIQDLLNTWIAVGQALVGSIGALAFVFAFLWRNLALFKAGTSVRDPIAVTLAGATRRTNSAPAVFKSPRS